MKDPITTAFVVKGAVTHPEYSMFLGFMPEGEVEAVDCLIDAADMLETVFTACNADEFDHLVFAYEIAEPFGAKIVEHVITSNKEMDMEMAAQLAGRLLAQKRNGPPSEPALSEDARRIQNDKLTDSSEALESSYFGIGLNEHPMFPFSGWQAEVANGNTQEGYWEYVYNCVHNWEESK